MEPFGKLKSVAIKSFSTRSASADCLNTLDGDGSKTPPNVDAQSETSSVTSYERLTDLIRWVPGSHTELFDAEDKLLAFVRSVKTETPQSGWIRCWTLPLDPAACVLFGRLCFSLEEWCMAGRISDWDGTR